MTETMTRSASERDLAEGARRPFGPVAAAFYAAGIGAVVLGLMTILSEASEAIHGWLEFRGPVGPLSGKTTVAVLAYAVSWIVLHRVLRRRDPDPTRVFLAAALMVALGIVMTFPPIFLSFAAE